MLAWGALLYSWLLAYVPAISTLHSGLLNQLLHSGSTRFDITGNGIASHSICLFKNLLHLPCLFCGLTRSFVLITQGQWQQSLEYHLLGIPAYLAVSLFAVFGLAKPHWAKRFLRLATTRPSLLAIMGIFALCWLWKLVHSPQLW